MFIVVTIPMTRLVDWLVARERRRGPPVAGASDPVGAPPSGPAWPSDRGPPQVVRRARGPARASTSTSPSTRSCASSARRGRASRRCCAASTCSSPSTPGGSSSRATRSRRRGVDVDRVRRRIGIVFQAFNLFPHMSVIDNVTLAPRKVLRRDRAEAEAEASELLERFGLADKRDATTRTGCPAASSSAWPSSVPWPCSPTCCSSTRSRAPSTRSWWPRSSTSSASWRPAGMTMVIATHEMGFAREIANRVCFLDAGGSSRTGRPAGCSASRASRGPGSSCSGSSTPGGSEPGGRASPPRRSRTGSTGRRPFGAKSAEDARQRVQGVEAAEVHEHDRAALRPLDDLVDDLRRRSGRRRTRAASRSCRCPTGRCSPSRPQPTTAGIWSSRPPNGRPEPRLGRHVDGGQRWPPPSGRAGRASPRRRGRGSRDATRSGCRGRKRRDGGATSSRTARP